MGVDATQPQAPPIEIQKKHHSRIHRFRIWRRACKAVADPQWGAKAFETFRDSVSGTFPAPSGEGVVLGACNELYYWKFAVTLLLSLEQHERGVQVHLHLCSPSAELLAHVVVLARSLQQIKLTWTTDDGRLAGPLEYPTVYLAAVRFMVAQLLMEHTRSPILCLDVDAIAVKPVWPAYAAVQGLGDVALIVRADKKHPTRKILASAVGYNPTPAGLKFVSSVARAIASVFEIRPIYHVDQILIFYVMREMVKQEALAVASMPIALADFSFHPDSVIWMPKGWALKNSSQYADAKQAVDACFAELASSGSRPATP